jgi:hypothetical protein
MGNPSWRRPIARLLLSLFAVFVGESLLLKSCPMHQGAVAQGQHASHTGQAGAPADAPVDPVPCGCLGDCVSAAPIALASAPVRHDWSVLARHSIATAVREQWPAAAAQVRLPFSQGPPGIAEF